MVHKITKLPTTSLIIIPDEVEDAILLVYKLYVGVADVLVTLVGLDIVGINPQEIMESICSHVLLT